MQSTARSVLFQPRVAGSLVRNGAGSGPLADAPGSVTDSGTDREGVCERVFHDGPYISDLGLQLGRTETMPGLVLTKLGFRCLTKATVLDNASPS